MKKILYSTLLLLSALSVSCTDEEVVSREKEVQVTASLTFSRTTFQENGNITHSLWEQGDAIGLSTATQSNLKYTANNAGAQAGFTAAGTTLENVDGTKVYAYYPYSSSSNGMEVALPSINTQYYATDKSNVDFIYTDGTITSSALNLKKFKHLFTFIRATIPLDLVPEVSGYRYLYVWSQSAPVNIVNGTFNLETNQIGVNQGNNDPNNKRYNNLYYCILSNQIPQGATHVTCYIAMLPQPAYADISLNVFNIQNNSVGDLILSKKAPAEGFKAGNIYTITLDGTEEKPDLIAERNALIDLYNSTNGGSWTKKTDWVTNNPINKWEGVYTNYITGRVSALLLAQNNLTGTLPESIGELSGINQLYLAFNNISGTFPESLSNLMNVPVGNLHLAYNRFSTDDIPASITGHTNWKVHWLSFIQQQSSRSDDLTKYNIEAPEFSLTDVYGRTISSATEYSQNKLTIFFKWNDNYSNAGNLNTIYDLYKEKGLNVIGYHHDCPDVVAYKQHLENAGIEWRNYVSTTNSNWIPEFTAYDIWTSHYFVVDENRKVIYHSVDPAGDEMFAIVKDKLGEPELYTSSDYSRDGEVFTVQEATVGKGINFVFLGEGFVDKDMEPGGKYEQKMKEAADKFFELEPYKSLRNRFNIYAVKVVSPHEVFIEGATHKFDEEKDETVTVNGTEYAKSDYLAFEYATKVTDIDWSATGYESRMMISIIYNTTATTGRSYCRMYGNGDFVGYMMAGVNEVLIHEVGGHGFAKLLDEYIEPGYENATITSKDIMYLNNVRNLDWGWAANVDYRTAPQVKWNHMLTDSRYSSEVTVLEGSYTYGKGAYRPTENSMMNQTIMWFNAPSREAIYKAIMTLSEGEEWLKTYDFEDFAAFDEANRGTQPFSARTALSDEERRKWQESHRPPVFVEGSWRDVLKNRITVPLR